MAQYWKYIELFIHAAYHKRDGDSVEIVQRFVCEFGSWHSVLTCQELYSPYISLVKANDGYCARLSQSPDQELDFAT